MNPAWMDFSNILTAPTPNHQSKPPLKQIWSDFFWPFLKKTSNQIHAGFMLNSCIFRRVTLYFHSCQIHVRFMLNSCIFNDSEIWCWIGGLFQDFGANLVGERLVLNSCWIHADFIFSLKFHNALRNILHHIGVEFIVLNSCWIQAKPWKIPKFANKVGFEKHLLDYSCYILLGIQSGISQKTAKIVKNFFFHGITWIQHEFSMNSTWIQRHCYAKCCAKHCENLRWKWNQHEISMNSTWIQHQSDLNCCIKHCAIQAENEISMKTAWIQHEFGMNSTPIWFQLLYKALWKRVCTNHFQCIIICLFRI